MAETEKNKIALDSSVLLRASMDHVSDSIYFKDIDSRFIAVNQSTADRFGQQHPSDVIRRTTTTSQKADSAQGPGWCSAANFRTNH